MKKKSPMEQYAEKRNKQLSGDKAKAETSRQLPGKSAMKGAKPEMTKKLRNSGSSKKRGKMTMAEAMGKTGKKKSKRSRFV